MPNQSSVKEALNRIFKIIREIVEKSANGNYIYRGEPEQYQDEQTTINQLTLLPIANP